MKELLNCCYELMEIELRVQHTDQLFTLLRMAERIDLLRRRGIIETRNDGHTAKKGKDGKFIGSEPYADKERGASDSDGSDGGGQEGASEQSGDITENKVESDLYKQDSTSLKRAIRRYQKRINEHKDKISHPEKYVRDWDTYDGRRRNGLLKHWNKEIQNFSVSIQRREDELKRRGDLDE